MKKCKALITIFVIFIFVESGMGQITEIGLASFYADKFDGRITASGATFDQNKMTAAHRTFPFGTTVKVTNVSNNKSVVVTINDRGPFVKDRVIDLSKSAAIKLDFMATGVAQVKVEVVSLGKSDAPVKTQEAIPSQKEAVQSEEKKPTVVNSTVVVASAVSVSEYPQNSVYEYYKLQSELVVPVGFGIQIASYQEASNLMKRCDEIRQNVNKDILIQVGDKDGEKIYRIIIGPFSTREAATTYNENMNGAYKGSFVITF